MTSVHGMPRRVEGRATAWLKAAGLSLALTSITLTAWANPQGGQVVAGKGSISNPNGSTTLINQQSNKLVIDWSSFNVATGQTVQFSQPSISAAALNRILDQSPSQIFGNLVSNGQVFLLNPNGIIFGRTASVNTGALFATSLGISNDDFMNGKLDFSAPAGEDGGPIVNHGLLQAVDGGSISLVGGAVYNDGVIQANLGQVDMVAGHAVTVDFDGDGLMQFEVTQPV
ncbi:MAG TPA: filamentous hemagglutinin N-terminal domain-containing protein, partial [Gammaproteobacteria bacterium]|nr:filamentous hemagglutinin N-terminal domain-containing protein [Gammaproteobacteria bacterium]